MDTNQTAPVIADSKAKKPIYKKWWAWLLALLVIAGIANRGNKPAAPEAAATAPTENVAQPVAAESSAPAASSTSSSGLGISRSAMIKAIGWDFTQGKDVHGEENYTAKAGNNLAQLIGPSDNLKSASFMVGITAGDDAGATTAGQALRQFADLVEPKSGSWISGAISKAAGSKDGVTKKFGNKTAEMSFLSMGESGAFVTLTYSAED